MIIQNSYPAYSVYILSNNDRSILDVGITGDLLGKIEEFKESLAIDFNDLQAKEKGYLLVYREGFNNVQDAMLREEVINKMSIRRKVELVNSINPDWRMLPLTGYEIISH